MLAVRTGGHHIIPLFPHSNPLFGRGNVGGGLLWEGVVGEG